MVIKISLKYSQCLWKHKKNMAKSIADKIDFGSLLLPVNMDDLTALESILSTTSFERPNLKLSIYKNRRGRYKSIILWCKAELGCCRVNPIFATTYDYEMIELKDLKITLEEEPSAF